MEKRALIAFVLSLLVLVFWEYYFGLFRTAETPPPPSTQESPTTPQPAPATPPGAAPPQTLPQALPQDRLQHLDQQFASWTVNDDLYHMQLLAPGGRINSFLLDKFRQAVDPQSPLMDMVPTRASGYLPLAVDLIHHQDWQLSTLPFTSPAPAQLDFTGGQASQPVTLTAEVPGQVRLTKTFTFQPDSYVVDLEIRLDNLSSQPLVDQMGLSFYYQPYTSLKEETSYNPSHLAAFQKGQLSTFAHKDLLKKEVTLTPPMDWFGYENNYFLQAVIPTEESGFTVIPRILDAERGLMQVVYLTEAFELGGNQQRVFKYRLYMGPKEIDKLTPAGHNLVNSVDYGWFTFIAKPMVTVLNGIYKFTHNYGVAIILLTVFIKILFWPLTQKSYKSMQMMKKVQPRINQIREKYKDDREKLNEELMSVYRTYKVNPMGGCLPMVLQIPVFFALYRMLNGAVELRHEPFMLWINDLTAPDRLHIGIDIPYMGGIPVLTLLMGVSMFLQQKMTPTGGDPRQEQIMLLMPVIFTVMFINFPSGLVLYWLVNNILSIAQQYWVNRQA